MVCYNHTEPEKQVLPPSFLTRGRFMFPEYRDLISKLKQEDTHFARIFEEHNELDDKISGLENNPVTSVTAQEEIDALKVKKLALKDQLFQLLKQAEAEGK
jgi:hypothetical protein